MPEFDNQVEGPAGWSRMGMDDIRELVGVKILSHTHTMVRNIRRRKFHAGHGLDYTVNAPDDVAPELVARIEGPSGESAAARDGEFINWVIGPCGDRTNAVSRDAISMAIRLGVLHHIATMCGDEECVREFSTEPEPYRVHATDGTDPELVKQVIG